MSATAEQLVTLHPQVYRGDALPPVRALGTGIAALDGLLPGGGFPRGRIAELHGPMAGGRMTLALHLIRHALDRGERAAVVDLPGTFVPPETWNGGMPPAQGEPDAPRGTAAGRAPAGSPPDLDAERLLIGRPADLQQALRAVGILTRSRQWGLVLLDLTGAPRMPSAAWLQRVGSDIRSADTVLLLLHARPVSPLGSPITLRLHVQRRLTEAGRALRVRVAKNKLAPPEGSVDLPFASPGVPHA